MEEAYFCTDCKMMTDVVFDHATGDVICTECALVLESHLIDEAPEWRIFADDDSNDKDPMRVGEPTTLLGDGVLRTVISDQSSLPKYRLKNCASNSQHSSLVAGFSAIAHMVERLCLVATIKKRFCSCLGMNKQSVKAAQEAIEKIQNSDTIDIRRTPTSVAAAVIYIITQVSKETKPIPLRDISAATGAAEGTIRHAYNDLYPHLPAIIPSWFANMEDLQNIFQVPKRH